MKRHNKKNKEKILLKTWNYWEKKKRQRGAFLSRYDLAYVGRDTVNRAAKVSPGVIKQATNDIVKMVKNRLNQAISTRGAQIERALPKILRGAIEDVYKTPFRLLGNFGRQQFNKITRKILC